MNLEKEIQDIKERNKKVESEKAWETSISRKILIILTTYVLMVLLLSTITNINPFVNAIVPTFGYFLSTISVPIIKKYWIKKYYS